MGETAPVIEHLDPAENEPKCSVCGHPKSIHEDVARGESVVANCAAEAGYPEDACPMCNGTCPGRHIFTSME